MEERRRANLGEVAKAYGHTPEEVDRAIRSLRDKTIDPYELGQVALYERNYPEAEKLLLKSKAEQREQLEKARVKMADIIFSLGQTYYEQGKYAEAVKEHREAAALRPGDGNILNSLGITLQHAGRYVESEENYLQSLKIAEMTLGAEHPSVAASLNNLASLYADLGRYAEAEPLFKRSLTIREKQLGPEHPDVATSLNNLGTLYGNQGK